ncbi:MAG: hypothetical protein AAGJ73_13510 [Pseudomonadota bacterium]
MTSWFDFWLNRSNWIFFVAAFAGQFFFSLIFLNGENSAWEKAVRGAGGEAPEEQIGFPPLEPERALSSLKANDAVDDYVLWQVIDIPFALLNVVVLSAAFGLFLLEAGLQHSVLRYLLWIPLIYLLMELIENSLVTAFALGAWAPTGLAALAQQSATTLKLVSGLGSFWLGIGCVVGAALISGIRLARR